MKRGESALSGGTTGQLPHESSASVVLPRLRTHVAEERRVAYDDWEAVPDAREGLVSLERHLPVHVWNLRCGDGGEAQAGYFSERGAAPCAALLGT